MKNFGLIIGAIFITGAILVAPYLNNSEPVIQKEASFSASLRLCTVTESVVAIGHQEATTILAAGSHQWAIIQQPLNATNTASLSIGGTAVLGQGYSLGNATTSNAKSELVFGFATNKPTNKSISMITSTGSTTVNVISCK